MHLDSPGAHHDLPASADFCAVSTATRLLGDRWSLLLVRELFVGNTRFTEIQEALPGLSRGLLASRLGYLTRLGIIERRVADQADLRAKHTYALTEAGRALGPVLAALGDWATHWQYPQGTASGAEPAMDLQQLCESLEPTALPSERVQVQFFLTDAGPAWLRSDRTGVRACYGVNASPSELVVKTSLETLRQLYWGTRTCRDALQHRAIRFEGLPAHARGFTDWFPHRPAVVGAPSDSDDFVTDPAPVQNQDYQA
ncbi:MULTISPECIES: winged helix-turn-helix transcriptional regulator [unclassified Aeromicrobium]|uniref:winged helix-turn-helix transcriptional regulator n=1 Tax=unclassified Aeromicrobium TaxID=2633570 RepID=UPI0037BE6406